MTMTYTDVVLIVGELVVDYTPAHKGAICKLRLGGVAHAARGLWAAEVTYSVAAFCPQYLVDEARRFLYAHGCREFIWLGTVVGAPNVTLIGDVTEVADQGYDDLMRDMKAIHLHDPLPEIDRYKRVVVFPGTFDLAPLASAFSADAKLSFDIAYDVEDLSSLSTFRGRIQALIISTSSTLFRKLGQDDITGLLDAARTLAPKVLLLKENRGGSRLFNFLDDSVEEIPATLGHTVNSVGVGDVYSSVLVGLHRHEWAEPAWRACQVATEYSQSTFPDDIKRNVQRSLKLPFHTLRALGGVMLPWHDRPSYPIYLAAPDFSDLQTPELDRATDSLAYHNFRVRRPIQENGELARPAGIFELRHTYHLDCRLLSECDVVFAVPIDRDPGTLVEIGMAIQMGKPVITFDPRNENANTMVIAGSSVYSADLDACLNGTFNAISELRANSQ